MSFAPMVFTQRLCLLVTLFFTLSSCKKKPLTEKQETRNSESTFYRKAPTLASGTLTNQMAQGETDLLKEFSNYDFPWQHWDKELLKKSRESQKPIFALLVSPLSVGSRSLGKTLSEKAPFKNILKDNYVCTVADTYANPELGALGYQLSGEIGLSVSFPMLMWLTHNGHPIAWIPVGGTDEKAFSKVFLNSHAMVDTTWKDDQTYTIKNSKENHDQRIKNLDRIFTPPPSQDPPGDLSRKTFFLSAARKVVSYYDKHSSDLDGIGGLLPSSAIRLLALQSAHPATLPEVRKNSRIAISGLFDALSKQSIHDGLDGLYFFARLSKSWNTPSLSKDLSSQALLSQCLMETGDLINTPYISEEGRNLLTRLEEKWMPSPGTSSVSSWNGQDLTDVYLFSYDSIQQTLSETDLPIATELFNLKKEGNISRESPYSAKYGNLNTIGSNKSAAEVAEKLDLTLAEVIDAQTRIRELLLSKRNKGDTPLIETQLALSDLALFGSAQAVRYQISPSQENLEKVVSTGEKILKAYSVNGTTLKRFPNKIPAKGIDYAYTTNFFLTLYSATFDPKWLQSARTLMNEALFHLRRDNLPLTEAPLAKSVVPIHIHSYSMIFSESSLGKFDLALGKLTALTGASTYARERSTIWKSLRHNITSLPIVYTDLLASCLIEETPLIAVLEGDPASTNYRDSLLALNTPALSSFIVIRPATGDTLAKLPDLGPLQTDLRVSLIKNGTILGQAENLDSFKILVEKALSEKE